VRLVLAILLAAAAIVAPRAAAEPVPPRPGDLNARLDQAAREARKALERSEPARVRDRVPTSRQIDRAAERREQSLKGALGQFHPGGSAPRARDEQIELLAELVRAAPGIIKGKADQWREVLPAIREDLAELLRERPPDDAPDDVKQAWLDQVRDLTDSTRRNLNIKRSAELTVPAAERQAEDAGLPERLVDEALAEAGLREEAAPAEAPTEPPADTPADTPAEPPAEAPESHLGDQFGVDGADEEPPGKEAGGGVVVGPPAPPEEDQGGDEDAFTGVGGSTRGLVLGRGRARWSRAAGTRRASSCPCSTCPCSTCPRTTRCSTAAWTASTSRAGATRRTSTTCPASSSTCPATPGLATGRPTCPTCRPCRPARPPCSPPELAACG
jgi:hypothetical protein